MAKGDKKNDKDLSKPCTAPAIEKNNNFFKNDDVDLVLTLKSFEFNGRKECKGKSLTYSETLYGV